MGEGDYGQQWRWDIAAVGLALAISCGVISLEVFKAASYPPVLLSAPLAVVSALSLLGRRRYPIPVAVFTGGLAVLLLSLDSRSTTVAVFVALYSLAKYERRWIAVLAGGIVIVAGTGTAGVFQSWDAAIRTMPWLIIFLESGIIAGEIAGRQQRALEAARARAAEAERTKEELARTRAAEERLRIARELHDSLTHAISVVNVQSSVALHMLSRQPDQAETALRNIREASQDAMRELRATLRALRVADTSPRLGVDSIEELIRRCRLPVRLSLNCEHGALSETLDRTVYRIVQEALTNVARHANAGEVHVKVDVNDDTVATTVTDDGIGPGPDGVAEGLGLMGMRERVAALGGRLDIGPAPATGFQITAVLPLSETTAKELTA